MVILSIDYGESRTGLAVCDKGEILASPAGTVCEKDRSRLIERIREQAIRYGAERLVVGEPINMDGSRGPRAVLCAEFAEELAEACALPCDLCDERLTTVQAHRALSFTDTRGKKRKQAVDSLAAVMILETYLARRKSV